MTTTETATATIELTLARSGDGLDQGLYLMSDGRIAYGDTGAGLEVLDERTEARVRDMGDDCDAVAALWDWTSIEDDAARARREHSTAVLIDKARVELRRLAAAQAAE